MLELLLYFSITLQIIIRFIYMSNNIWLIGTVGSEITLTGLIQEVEATNNSDPLNINIHSPGGNPYEGFAMYSYLKRIGKDREVNTNSIGLVASAATIFFLAGRRETRTIGRYGSPLMHEASTIVIGKADDLEKETRELKRLNSMLSDVYVAETDLTKEQAEAVMHKDEMLSPEYLKSIGFISEIEDFEAAALTDILNINNKNNNMAEKQLTKEEASGLFDNFFEKFKNAFGSKDDITSKIIQDATGIEIDFVNVAKGDEPQIGDEAEIDGKKAVGDITMKDGSVWTFKNGKYDSMKPKEEDATAALNDKITALTAELETSKGETVAQEAIVTTMTATIGDMETEVTKLKDKVVSSFDYDKKDKKDKKQGDGTRQLFKDKKQ